MFETPIPVARSKAEIRQCVAAWRAESLKIGLVPTMGALHDGHLSLVRRAAESTDRIVASIFVNPTQFAPGEDFDSYPRNEADDLAKLAEAGCHLAYVPSVEEMYPEGSLTDVRVAEMSDLLDGAHRPHFFYGVSTIVARLFIHVAPDVAVFGEKDFQQLQILKRMTRDLGFSIEIIGGPTVRDADGLAQSSRNAYLTEAERPVAGAVYAALHRARRRIEIGVSIDEALTEAEAFLVAAGMTSVDYVSACDPETLTDLAPGPAEAGADGRLLAAAWLGATRLIDNIGFKRPA